MEGICLAIPPFGGVSFCDASSDAVVIRSEAAA